MSIDLKSLSLPELIQLQSDLASLIVETQKTEKVALRKQMEELAKQSGFTFDEIISGTKETSKKSKVKPKYCNPANAEQTWTGRGRKPKWVEEALANNKALDDLLIQD